jgi:hypothetical protein
VADPQSRDALIIQYMPLATHVSKILWRTKPQVRRLGEWEDVRAYAYEGLIHAADGYIPDHPKHASFKTYAYRAIYLFVIRKADGCGMIRVPATSARAMYSQDDRKKLSQPLVEKAALAMACRQMPDSYDYPEESINDFSAEEFVTAVKQVDDSDILLDYFGLEGRLKRTMMELADSYKLSLAELRDRRNRALEALRPVCLRLGLDPDVEIKGVEFGSVTTNNHHKNGLCKESNCSPGGEGRDISHTGVGKEGARPRYFLPVHRVRKVQVSFFREKETVLLSSGRYPTGYL